jgi:hypothetical protein
MTDLETDEAERCDGAGMALNQGDREWVKAVVEAAVSQLNDDLKGWSFRAIQEAHKAYLEQRETTCPLRDLIILRPYKLGILLLLTAGGGGGVTISLQQLLRFLQGT